VDSSSESSSDAVNVEAFSSQEEEIPAERAVIVPSANLEFREGSSRSLVGKPPKLGLGPWLVFGLSLTSTG